MTNGFDDSPSGLAARAAEQAVHHGHYPGRLPASPKRIGNPVRCPAGARLTEAGCAALRKRAAKALDRGKWSDSMAWYCGHCPRSGGLRWRIQDRERVLSHLSGQLGMEDVQDPLNSYTVSSLNDVETPF